MIVRLSRLAISAAIFAAVAFSATYVNQYIRHSNVSFLVDDINRQTMTNYEAFYAHDRWAVGLMSIWGVFFVASGVNFASNTIDTLRHNRSVRAARELAVKAEVKPSTISQIEHAHAETQSVAHSHI